MSHYRMALWVDSSKPQQMYIGKITITLSSEKTIEITVINMNAPTNTLYNGYIVCTHIQYDNAPGQFPNDYIYNSISYNDLTVDPTTREISSASGSLISDLTQLNNNTSMSLLYIILVPKTPVYIPYFSNDVFLSTILDTSQLSDAQGANVGPNRVFELVPPVSGQNYIYENGLDPGEGGEIVANSLSSTQPLSGYPIIKDEKSNGFFNINNAGHRSGLITYKLFYIYGDTLQILLLGTFTINCNLNNQQGVYGAIHNPQNDSLYIPISGMINFWESDLSPSTSLSDGIHLLDIGSKFRENINTHSTNLNTQSSIQILGTSDVYTASRISGVSYILPRGGTWGIDVDGYGNIYATLGDGYVIKVKNDYSSYSILCNGLLEPWNVCVIDKNSLKPTLLVANTRYGTIILVNPDGSVQTICGTPVMPYQEGYGKTIHDTSVTYPHGVFGCPTSVTITPDYSILVGDETGLAIRKIVSPTLAYKIQQLQGNQPSKPIVQQIAQPVVQQSNEDSSTTVILILLLLFLLIL